MFDYDVQKAVKLITEKLYELQDEPKPTLIHCVRVGCYLYDNGYSREVVLGGFLHDVVEDSDVDRDFLVEEFGEEVADIVMANTANDDLSGDEKKQEVVNRCLGYGIDSTVVMAAEVLDGLKYYKKVGNHEQLTNKIKKAKIFLDKVEYEGAVFDELREFVEEYN